MSQPLEYEQVTQNASEGAQFGRTSTELIAFYGATPITRPVTAATNNASTATSISMSTVGQGLVLWSFPTRQAAENVQIAASTCQYAMKQLGLIV